MGRKLFTFLSTVSLVLCAAAVVLWVRSYRVEDAFEFRRRDGRWQMASAQGRLWVYNEPQRLLEHEPLRLARLRVEGVNRRIVEVSERLSELTACRRGAAPRPGAEEEAAGVELDRLSQESEDIADAFTEARRRLIDLRVERDQKPQTPPAGYSVAYPVPVAAAAAPPLAWLGWVPFTRRRRRARLRPL